MPPLQEVIDELSKWINVMRGHDDKYQTTSQLNDGGFSKDTWRTFALKYHASVLCRPQYLHLALHWFDEVNEYGTTEMVAALSSSIGIFKYENQIMTYRGTLHQNSEA